MAETPPEPVRRWTDRLARVPLGVALLALVAYVPLLLTRPGQVGADTKTYLYLDPGRLLSRAAYMWDPNVGLGTVTHQNIGYLWPMGPFYWLFETVGIPDWVAQRIWLGSIILLAGLGVRFMMRELRWVGAGVTVASFAYALSPYLLDYAARISVILLPFAGLPWLIGLAARSLRRDDWRSPAWFALVTLTVGGVNATSLVLVMVGPILWFAHAVWIEREVTLRRALAAGGRITVLTAATSMWWVAGLSLQGSHGIPILRYTETYETVADASLSTELMRGLGYWFFYGSDGLGPWTEASVAMVENVPLLAVSFVLPLLGVAAMLWTRFRHRVFFAGIVLIGLVVGAGAHPWDDPSPYGRLFRAFTGTDLGLSMRSTPRAVPLIALGLAVALGAGLAALSRWRPGLHRPVALALILLICVNQAPLFLGQVVDRYLVRDEQLPEHWLDAAADLDAGDRDTRVWELPGIDFASYRWGSTVDPVTPGLMDREFVARELIPYGTPPAANLVNEMDLPFQSATVQPSSIAPLARFIGAGELLFRSEMQYERYRSPRPRMTYEQLRDAPGLAEPVRYGEPVPNIADDELPLDDPMEYGIALDAPEPAPLMRFGVEDPRPVLRTVAAASPTVLAGDAAGIVALAGLGALPADRPVFSSADFADDPDALREQIDEPEALLVVSDTNRRQARRWGGVRENDGYTERAGEEPLVDDPSDNRLEVFPDEGEGDQTLTEQRGGATVAASAYGNGVSFTPGDRAVGAFDDDPDTAWRVAAFDDPVGEFLRLVVDEPLTTDRIGLLQVQGPKNRHLTRVTLRFDDTDELTVELTEASRTEPGQVVEFEERTFSELEVVLDATDRDGLLNYRGISDVGFSEIDIPGLGPITEAIRPPTALLDTAGDRSIDRDLMYVFTRRAAASADVLINPEELALSRWVINPFDREYTMYGRARLNAGLSEADLDRLLGRSNADEGGVDAVSSVRLAGGRDTIASSAVDGDPTTAYRTPFNQAADVELRFTYAEPVAVDGLDLTVVADGRHSVPSVLSVTVDDGDPVTHRLEGAELGEGRPRGATTTLAVPTGPLEGRSFRISIDEVVESGSLDWFGKQPIVRPAAITDVGLPSVPAAPDDTPLDDACRDDLVQIDGQPVSLSLEGTVGEARAGSAVTFRACDGPVGIAAGRQLLTTQPRAEFDIEELVLSSAAGGGPGIDTLSTPLPTGAEPPATSTERTGRNDHRVDVNGAQDPYWVVLGQSYSDGWRATTSDGADLGEPTLVNGFGNGWRIDPAEMGADVTVDIAWTPQRIVWIGIAVSILGVLLCLVLILRPPRRARGSSAGDDIGASGHSRVSEPSPTAPRLHDPRRSDGPSPGVGAAAVLALGSGLVALVVIGPVAILPVALLVALAGWFPWGSTLLRLAAVGSFAAAVGYTVLRQWRNGFELDFAWPQWFEATHRVTLTAVVLMVAAVVVDGVRSRAAEPRAPDQAELNGSDAPPPPTAPGSTGRSNP